MCGISGQLNFERDNHADESLVRTMNNCLGHRGPDDEGYFFDHNIGLGHKRLAIIDLHTGQQPILTGDKKAVIVFNGEIYNFPEIKKELQDKGYTFYTMTDTETVLNAFLEWGSQCFDRFNGEWAMAIWLADKQELILSRDRYGIKPLYYIHSGKNILFSSEIKSFKAVKTLEPDMQEVWDQLVFGPKAGGKTIWKGVNELEHGTYLSVIEGQVKQYRWYNLAGSFRQEGNYDRLYLEDLVTDSIQQRLMSDVPVGTLNSGGIDSSLISAIAKDKIEGGLLTFSIAPEKTEGRELPGDESAYAEVLAKHIESRHTTIRYSQELFLDDLPDAISYNDNILYHPNAIPLSYLFKEIKEKHHVTVLLGGEGADEVFRGYSYNKLAILYQRYGIVVKKLITSRFAKLQAVQPLVCSLSFPMQMAIARNSHLSPALATQLTGFKGRLSDDRYTLITEAESLKGLDKLIFYEQKCYMAGLLQRIDRMSLRHGIEARVPFLDHRIVEYVNGIKPSLKSGLTNESLKKILKKIAVKQLPPQIIKRKKYGFAAPIVAYANEIDRMILQYQPGLNTKTDIHQRYILLNYFLLHQ